MINSLKTAARNGSPISVSGIARHAGVDRTFLYRHRDLLALVHAAELEPAGQDGTGAAPVSRISLALSTLFHCPLGLMSLTTRKADAASSQP
ncbi:hypothetical protein SPURM210S_05683 [Streptomyces purpurascens]